MNQRNMDALLQILRDFGFVDDQPDFSINVLADYLASRGVLVPTVLTDGQCEAITMGWDDGVFFREDAIPDGHGLMREKLERIARGDS